MKWPLIRRLAALAGLVILLASPVLAAGCGEKPVIGAVDDRATVALMRFEAQSEGISGVVYRQVNRLGAFLAQSTTPVLVVFYDSLSPVNSLIIPHLAQMADDRRDKLQIVWIDARKEESLADSFKVEELPQFTVVVGASLKRSLVGYDTEWQVRLDELLAPYLDAP